MADLSKKPNYVNERPPEYNVEMSEGESLHQTTYKLDNNAIRKYDLHYGYVSLADRNTLRDHYDGQYGHYASFSWTNPPSHINSGVAFTVRYDRNEGYQEETPPVGHNAFKVTLVLMKVP